MNKQETISSNEAQSFNGILIFSSLFYLFFNWNINCTNCFVCTVHCVLYILHFTYPRAQFYSCTVLQVKRDPLETECTDDRSSVALCNLVNHGHELPPHLQNFDRKQNHTKYFLQQKPFRIYEQLINMSLTANAESFPYHTQ